MFLTKKRKQFCQLGVKQCTLSTVGIGSDSLNRTTRTVSGLNVLYKKCRSIKKVYTSLLLFITGEQKPLLCNEIAGIIFLFYRVAFDMCDIPGIEVRQT